MEPLLTLNLLPKGVYRFILDNLLPVCPSEYFIEMFADNLMVLSMVPYDSLIAVTPSRRVCDFWSWFCENSVEIVDYYECTWSSDSDESRMFYRKQLQWVNDIGANKEFLRVCRASRKVNLGKRIQVQYDNSYAYDVSPEEFKSLCNAWRDWFYSRTVHLEWSYHEFWSDNYMFIRLPENKETRERVLEHIETLDTEPGCVFLATQEMRVPESTYRQKIPYKGFVLYKNYSKEYEEWICSDENS